MCVIACAPHYRSRFLWISSRRKWRGNHLHQSNINLISCSHSALPGSICTRCRNCKKRKKKSMHLYILQSICIVWNIWRKSKDKPGYNGGKRQTEMWKRMFLILHCKDILEGPKLFPPFSVFRVSVPSPVVTAAANPHTLRIPSCQPCHNPLTWTMGTQNPTTATAMGMGMEPGTLSTTTQQVFMLTMAVMGTDPCQARWEALAWVLHTGEGGTFHL